MDPRQPPQHPFSSRNTASPYGHASFPSTSNQSQYPSSSHPPPAAPAYHDQQRRPSDPPYYNPQRSYGQEGPPISGPSHSRHQSASSVGHGTPVNRGMPPPSSPQQQTPQPSHHYGPPPPRAPPVSVGPPSAFPSSRELPSLPSLGRPASGRDNMSISSMLGGPSPASREAPPSQSQYVSPVAASAPPTSMFSSSHVSPRLMNTTGPDYAPFRRPQTPEHQRQYEPRDNRANSAGSPPGIGHYGTPEARRFGTPQQSYAQRVSGPEERREPIRVPNPNAANSSIPPRPNSQPSGFNPPPPTRLSENPRPPIHNESLFGRRVENVPRPEPPRDTVYGRPAYEERHAPYNYAERDRQERERERERELLIQRDRDLRERERDRLERDRERERVEHEQREYAHQMTQRNAQPSYNRPPESREQPWMRQTYDAPPPPRPAYEQPPSERPPPQASNGYNYPTTTAPQYGGHSAYSNNEGRYGQAPQPSSIPHQHETNPGTQYEAAMQERQRLGQQQEQQRQAMYGGPPQNGPYMSHESPQRRPIEEGPQMQQQRSFLGVQEINRKGNRSPLPQAVQGAQSQLNAPGGEPAIKNEFGRIFSGLGGGSGAMGVPSPLSAGTQGLPFSTSGQLRREDLENLQDSPLENGQKISRTASRNGRRRKLKEEGGGDDESSTGRHTPSGRGKRAKNHHHHHHHHHHHRAEPVDNTSSPSQSNLTPFKSIKGSTVPSPPGRDPGSTPTMHHHHIQRHHHHVTQAKPAVQVNTVIPLRKVTIRSQEVLDAVAGNPRKHLGHAYYHSTLKPDPLVPKRDFTIGRGFASTPQPLPRFEGNENCKFTVKVARVHLTDISREEITTRRAVWGTDIYTDDSDVIAACIHQGWFKGAWPPGVDESLLGLELENDGPVQPNPSIHEIWTKPPPSGPADVPKNRDLHVTILVLPLLDKYGSITRFGIRSREWGGKYDGFSSVHDGLSFMIDSIQWIDGVDGEEARTGHGRRENIMHQFREAEMEAAEALEDLVLNASGAKPQFEESFERGSEPGPEERVGDIRGIGTNSWWKKANGVHKEKGKEKEKEKEEKVAPVVEKANDAVPLEQSSTDVEQEQERRISRVTELMIENANTAEGPAVLQPEDPVPAAAEAQPAHDSEIKQENVTDERINEHSNATDGVPDQDTDMDTTL